MSTRRELTKRMIITYGQYVINKDARKNTTFRILPTGESGYVINDELVTEDVFKEKYPLPLSLVYNNSEGIDGTKNWMVE